MSVLKSHKWTIWGFPIGYRDLGGGGNLFKGIEEQHMVSFSDISKVLFYLIFC